MGNPLDGPPVFPCNTVAASILQAGALGKNRATLAKLRHDEHSEAVWRAARSDHEKGRMSELVRALDLPLDSVLLSPRFSVPQPNKVRPVDDATASGLNKNTDCCEKMSHDTADVLAACTAKMVQQEGMRPHFWKAARSCEIGSGA